MPDNTQTIDAIIAHSPALGGTVIGVTVQRLSAPGEGSAFARVGAEDGRPYLERHDGTRAALDLDVDAVRDELEAGVVVVREYMDEGRGATREYPVEGLSPDPAPRF